MILRTSKSSTPGITSTQGTSGVRAALRSRTAAMGVATVLAAAPALAQDTPTPEASPEAPPSAPASPAVDEAAPAAPQPVEAAAVPAPPEAPPAPRAPPAPPAPPAAAQAPSDAAAIDELESFTLPTVHVQGADARPTSSGLTRLPTKILDTPQTVVVVPEAMLKEQRAVTMRDALRNVSGITSNAGEGGRQGDSFLIRGFSAQNDVFRDGGRDNGWYTRDTFNLDGVEVFFGPSSVLFGRGATGGAINLVTKKPMATNFNSVVLSAGTSPTGRVELDVNRVVDEKVQVRLNLAGQLSGVAGRDVVRQDRLGVAPSIGIQLTDTARLEVDHLYQREDGVPDYGHPLYNGRPVGFSMGVPRETFYGVRGSDVEEVDANIFTARLLQELGKGSRLTNTLRMARVERFARPTAPRGVVVPADGSPATVGRQRFETETDNDYLFDQLDLRFAFTTGIIEHALNVGAEASFEHRAQQRHNLRVGGANQPADLLDPNPAPDLSGVDRVFGNASDTRQTTAGVYLADQLKITRYFELLGSARFDWFQTEYTTFGAASDATPSPFPKKVDRMFNWRVGAVVHPVKDTSVYAMYGTSSNPSAELGALSDGTISLDPERNSTIEIGAKTELLAGQLALGVSAFRVEKENGRLPNPDPADVREVLEGVQRVDGINVNASGEVSRIWRIFANYTFMHSEIRNHTNPFIEGQPVPSTPKHSASLWTTVEVLPRLTLGAGATGQTDNQVNNPANETTLTNVIPGFVRFDAYAAYAFQAFDLQLNVNNLGNRYLYEAGYSGHAVPAAARSAMLTARFGF